MRYTEISRFWGGFWVVVRPVISWYNWGLLGVLWGSSHTVSRALAEESAVAKLA